MIGNMIVLDSRICNHSYFSTSVLHLDDYTIVTMITSMIILNSCCYNCSDI